MSNPRTESKCDGWEHAADLAVCHLRGFVVTYLSLEVWGYWPGLLIGIALNLVVLPFAAAWGMWRTR